MDGQGDGGEILFPFSFQEVGSHLVQRFDSPIRWRVFETKSGRGSLSTESRRKALTRSWAPNLRVSSAGKS